MGYYIVFINLVALVVMGIDKRRSIKHEWRISEKCLFTLAIIGGAIGIYFGMYAFSHKTKHLSFKLGIPLLIGLNLIIYYGLSLLR